MKPSAASAPNPDHASRACVDVATVRHEQPPLAFGGDAASMAIAVHSPPLVHCAGYTQSSTEAQLVLHPEPEHV
jgi:hypothetical protein